MEKITILLADDHRLLRESWYYMLNNDCRFHVIAGTGNGAEAIELVKTMKPDIVLTDLNMAPVDGFEITRQICKNECSSRVIGLSMHNNIGSVRRLLVLGAMGYLTKDSSKEEMKSAIIEVRKGNKYICKEVKNILSQQESEDVSLEHSLSKREIEIVQHVKKGLSSKEIGLMLDIVTKTVEMHRYNILKKLNVKNSASLINFCNISEI